MISSFRSVLCIALVVSVGVSATAQEPGGGLRLLRKKPALPALKETNRFEHDAMAQVTSVAVSPDGKHVYAAAFDPGVLSVLDRNPETGQLRYREAVKGEHQRGLVAFRLSPDGKYGAGSAFGDNSLILYKRDLKTGKLKKIDHMGSDRRIRELDFCIDNVFSPDGRFIYAIGSLGVCAFEIKEDKLRHLGSYSKFDAQGVPLTLDGRGIAVSPNGQWLYTTWQQTGALVVFECNKRLGTLKASAFFRAKPGGVPALNGVMGCVVSPKGTHVYTASGRFNGNNAVCVFSVDGKGKLTHQQSLTDDLPKGFGGGNEIAVSPDGKEVTVVCTTDDQVARFSRDATGELTAVGCIPAGPIEAPGAAGLTFTRDGTFLLVADEASKTVLVYKRGGE